MEKVGNGEVVETQMGGREVKSTTDDLTTHVLQPICPSPNRTVAPTLNLTSHRSWRRLDDEVESQHSNQNRTSSFADDAGQQ